MRHAVALRTLAATAACAVFVTSTAEGSPRSRAQTRTGYALAYDLQFAASLDAFDAAVATDPLDPAPHRAIAAITWMEILFAQGVATFEAFTGIISKADVTRPVTPPLLAQRFQRSITRAGILADEQLARGDGADAQYQVGATAALSAVFRATVEGRTLGALTQGRRAVAAMERARARDPRQHESALVLGMSEYTVSTMPWPVRVLAKLNGLDGNREGGAGPSRRSLHARPGHGDRRAATADDRGQSRGSAHGCHPPAGAPPTVAFRQSLVVAESWRGGNGGRAATGGRSRTVGRHRAT